MKVRYHLGTAEEVQIWARPYTLGHKTLGCRAHGSPRYRKEIRESAIIDCWFLFESPAEVDEIRVRMCDSKTSNEIIILSCKISARWITQKSE